MNRSAKSGAGDFLTGMAQASRERLQLALDQCSEATLLQRIAGLPAPAGLQLSGQGFDLIAEIKRRSPAAGQLAGSSLDPVAQAQAYSSGGAAALSVLTEPTRFDGELADLEQVVSALPRVPVMRKDFLVDPYQVLEARANGASGVLLIAAMLDSSQLTEMLSVALEQGLFVLVEAFDAADLDHCLPVMQGQSTDGVRESVLLGINCRDLRSLEVDFERFEALAPRLPACYPRVAESGVSTPEQAVSVARLGYQLALVGTALMRAADPAVAAQAMLHAARASR